MDQDVIQSRRLRSKNGRPRPDGRPWNASRDGHADQVFVFVFLRCYLSGSPMPFLPKCVQRDSQADKYVKR